MFLLRLLCILAACFVAFRPLIYLRSFIKKKNIVFPNVEVVQIGWMIRHRTYHTYRTSQEKGISNVGRTSHR